MAAPREQALAKLAQARLQYFRTMFEPHPLRMSSGMHYLEQTKYVTWDCSKFKDPIEILHMTDMQWGHVLCREDKVIEYRDWILKEPNRFIVLGGDCIDAGTRVSVGSPWEQKMEPQGQIYQFCETFAPVRHRILGYVGGNHERRGVLTFGDLGSLIAHLLEIPYSAGIQWLDFTFGRGTTPFRMDLWHGKGASTTAGAKMQMLHKHMQTGDSQIYLVGHLHDAMCKFDWRLTRRPGNKIELVKIAGAMSSSFLEYVGSYAEVSGLPPSGLMMARVIAEPDGKWELTMR